jgi:hypothetical protein
MGEEYADLFTLAATAVFTTLDLCPMSRARMTELAYPYEQWYGGISIIHGESIKSLRTFTSPTLLSSGGIWLYLNGRGLLLW